MNSKSQSGTWSSQWFSFKAEKSLMCVFTETQAAHDGEAKKIDSHLSTEFYFCLRNTMFSEWSQIYFFVSKNNDLAKYFWRTHGIIYSRYIMTRFRCLWIKIWRSFMSKQKQNRLNCNFDESFYFLSCICFRWKSN